MKKIWEIFCAPFEFVAKYFKVFVLILIVAVIFAPSGKSDDFGNANLARIDLKGAIFESDIFLENLQKLRDNPQILGILLVIDSPGGALAPSSELASAIKRAAQIKPLVAYASGSMASGSYLAAMNAEHIMANSGALIGSIGVIFNGADISELMAKIGIKEQSAKAGIYKEAGTFMRKWNENEQKMIESLLSEQYEKFVSSVVNARGAKSNGKISMKNEAQWAQGRIFSADSAKELGLIDSVGDLESAKILLAQIAGVKEPIWLKKDVFEQYLEKLLGEGAKAFSNAFLSAILSADSMLLAK